MKKTLVFSIILVAMGAVALYVYFSGKEYVIRLTEAQIRETLEKKLPLTKTYLFIFETTLENPRVSLEDGSERVDAGLDIVLHIKIGKESKPLGGSMDVSGEVLYRADKGQFFLTEPMVENLTLQGIPEKYIRKAKEVLTKALTHYYEEHPIYTLKATEAKQAAAKLVLKNVLVENKELVILLGV